MSVAVSVIVPCYNAQRTVAATIESALAEGSLCEIIAIDDGSRDDTLKILRRFEPRIAVLTGANAGVSAARNRGIAAARGEWFLFLDADDLLHRGSLAQRLEAAKTSDAGIVVCDWMELREDGSTAPRALDWPAVAADGELAAATTAWATTAAILYRRDVVERVAGFRSELPVIQDARFFFDAVASGARIIHAPHTGASYRIAAQSLSRADPARFWRDVAANALQVEDLWRGRGTLDAGRRAGLAGVYDMAARELLKACDPQFHALAAARRRLNIAPTRHGAVAEPLARLFGLKLARAVVGRLSGA